MMRGYFGEDRCCCTKKQNMWIVLDLGVKCSCMSDEKTSFDSKGIQMWFASKHGVYPT